jgi:hypothetical protein
MLSQEEKLKVEYVISRLTGPKIGEYWPKGSNIWLMNTKIWLYDLDQNNIIRDNAQLSEAEAKCQGIFP